MTDRNYVCYVAVRTIPTRINFEQIGWNVEFITVGDAKLRRDWVSNKEIADEKVEEGCTRGLNLLNKRMKEKNFRGRTNCAA